MSTNLKNFLLIFLNLILIFTLCACNNNSGKDSSAARADGTTSSSQLINDLKSETSPSETDGRHLLDEFFISIGTDISRSDIDSVAKAMGLYIDYKNTGTGIYKYRIATDKKIADVNYPENGSYIAVSFNGLKDDTISEITYFDAERMIAGYWSPDSGYLIADYNYPQIVYYDEDSDKVYSRTPVEDAKEIINYSSSEDISENLLETLFTSISSETSKDDLLSFVNENGLSYNSRGAGNEQVIAYCYEIGDKYGENGSYITFSVNEDGLVSIVTYYYYPANYKNGYRANFYSESYAAVHSVPSGFVLESKDGLTEYSSSEELLAQLHN